MTKRLLFLAIFFGLISSACSQKTAENENNNIQESITADDRKIEEQPLNNSENNTGNLVFGNYVCTESVWNGPNKSPAYSYTQRGYFELKKDGTYRWLDNGGSGKYAYNTKTGEIKWLSGHLYDLGLKTSVFKKGKTVSQIDLIFTTDDQWECGCNNK